MASRLELPINPAPPEVMHIDLNSAFAMAEQQANPLLRGRPVGVTNRRNDYAICITASYEARRHGVGIGTRLREARLRAPGFVMVESDPAKYHYVNRCMREIFESYSSRAYMKSVDEGVIDFRGMRNLLQGRSLEDIGREIKQRVRDEVGDYMTVNVGIGQNHWLAKVAAGFMKPDGLYVIGRDNLEAVYGLLRLTDLPYIKVRNAARLCQAGIGTPLDFLRAPEVVLRRQVFCSIMGRHWYLKLRGYETEAPYDIRTVGRSYVLEHRTADPAEIAALLMRACWKVARRLRTHELAARGLWLQFGYARSNTVPVQATHTSRRYGWPSWRGRKLYATAVTRGDQLYERAFELFRSSPAGQVLTSIVITAYDLVPATCDQLSLPGFDDARPVRLESAVQAINDRYGELTIAPALAFKARNPMPDKVPFGSVRYFD